MTHEFVYSAYTAAYQSKLKSIILMQAPLHQLIVRFAPKCCSPRSFRRSILLILLWIERREKENYMKN